MDSVGIALIGTFIFMMFASVFGLAFLAPPKQEKRHRKVRSSVIG